MGGPLRQGRLESGESVRSRWPAALPSPGGWVVRLRGDLVLTDRRLIFDPLEVRQGLAPLAAPEARTALRSLLRPLMLTEIVAATAGTGRPALARIDTARGELVVAVLASHHARTWSGPSRVARDGFLVALTAALS